MMGKNNQQLAHTRHADQRQRFAVRKLGIGVVSVLIGAVLAGGTYQITAQADAVTDSPVSATASLTTATTVTLQAPTPPVNSASAVTTSESNPGSTTLAAAPTSSVATSDTAEAPAVAATTGKDLATSPASSSTAQSTVNAESRLAILNQPMVLAAQPMATITDPTSPTDTPLKVVSGDDRSSMELGQNTVGNDGTTNGILLTLVLDGQPGDVYTIRIPKSAAYNVTLDGSGVLTSDMGGTTTQTTSGDYDVITYDIIRGSIYTFYININRENGYRGRDKPMTDHDPVGTLARQIEWSLTRNNVTTDNPSLTLWQKLDPLMDPQTPVPYGNKNLTEVPAGQNRNYLFKVNENNGIDAGYKSAFINSAVNSGTTITIPVPAHFVLDEAATSSKNNFDDKTTITQPGGEGHDIIITVPKGSGRQNWQGGDGYWLVGKFDITDSAERETLTAVDNPLASNHGEITVDQTVQTPQGEQVLTHTATPWQITVVNSKGVLKQGELSLEADGNNQDGNFLLDNDPNDDPAIINYFGFGNRSTFDLTDYEVTIEPADGLFATGFRLPVSLAGTTSYAYTITLANGQEIKGIAKPGATISMVDEANRLTTDPAKQIKKIVLHPDLLAAGEQTDPALKYRLGGNYGPTGQNNRSDLNGLLVYGHLMDHLADGTKITKQTKLSSKITAYAPSFSDKLFSALSIQSFYGEDDLRGKVSAILKQGTDAPDQ